MISVVIAVKNELPHIKECLTSLENQTYPDFETIFVDGGSTDGTCEYLQEKARKNNRFTLLKNPSGDAAQGRNIGLEKADLAFRGG